MTAHFRPPTVVPPAKPLGPIAGIVSLVRNPITFWPASLYEGSMLLQTRGSRRFVDLSGPDLIQTVLLDDADAYGRSFLSDRLLKPALGNGLLTIEGEEWRKQRRIAAPAFRPQMLAALLPGMVQAGEETVARLRRGGRIDVMPEMGTMTFDVIMKTMLGLGTETVDHDALTRDLTTYLNTIGRIDPLDLLEAPLWLPRPWKWLGNSAVRRIRATAAGWVATKRAAAEETDDLASRIIRASDPESGSKLSDQDVIDNLITFMTAGHETTALALTWTLFLLAHQPDWQERLAAEAREVTGAGPIDAAAIERLPLHKLVIQESLRLYPPAAVISRSVLRPTQIGEVEVRPGDTVTVVVYITHRHRTLWEDPDAFDPERFLPERSAGRHRFAYLPFGGGPHVCIGNAFAMMEAVALLATMLRDLSFAPAEPRPLVPVLRITLRPSNGMPLMVSARA